MPFGANDGQRINIRMSDMIRTRTEYGGGADEWYSSNGGAVSNIGVYSDVTRQSGGFRLSSMTAVLPYTDSNYDGADTGIYSIDNRLDGVYGSSGSMYENPVIYSYMNSRYRSGSNAAPSNINPPFSSGEMKFGDMVGVGNSCLTTDSVGQVRGVTNQVSAGTKNIQGFHQRDLATNGTAGGVGMSPGASVNSAGTLVGTNPSDSTGAANIGYSVYTTTYTNAWTHCKLNTKLCAGDRVLVIAHGGGGDMYTFSTTDPLYLRNESTGGSVSVRALITTHMAPHKNTTGQDDNMAIYSATCTQDGATVVGVNPYHSSAQPYIFHIFCIKGPSTYIDGITNETTKYTISSADTTIKSGTNLGVGIPTPDAMQRSQRFYIGISSSPFYNNKLNLTNSTVINQSTGEYDRAPGFGLGATEGYNSYYHEGGSVYSLGIHYSLATYGFRQGAFFTSVCDYTGGTRGSSSAGKFGINYNNIQGFYTPEFAFCRPAQDSRVLLIRGRRGVINHTP